MLKRLPQLQCLQAFLAVAHTSSFGSAAQELHLSQSSISRLVMQLEDHFGCRLFERHTRRVSLSEAGRRLLPITEQMMELLTRAHREVAQRQETITVRVHPTFAMRWLMPRLPQLYATHPSLRVNLDTAWSRVPDFALEGIDAMVEYGTGPWPKLRCAPLWNERLTPICHPDMGVQVSGARAIRKQVLLHFDADHSDWRRWAALARIKLEACTHMKFDTLDLAMTAAMQGQGIALGDLALIDGVVSTRQLVRPHPAVLETGGAYVLIFPAASMELESFRVFYAWLLDEASQTRTQVESPAPAGG